ncbi:hypothetical protein [Vulcaniibacterium gelatinicum]|uniref:hypothetical protein n=1 Tax=Vulcaniibacterium gelatinicum TaxID=2598725 RepID=UPI0011CB0857|nr:hypothetical protein [Vulcaniibacterium gelatinicum]
MTMPTPEMLRVAAGAGLSGGAAAVWLALAAAAAERPDGIAALGDSALAAATGRGSATIARARRELIAAGLVEQVAPGGTSRGGQRTPAAYRLIARWQAAIQPTAGDRPRAPAPPPSNVHHGVLARDAGDRAWIAAAVAAHGATAVEAVAAEYTAAHGAPPLPSRLRGRLPLRPQVPISAPTPAAAHPPAAEVIARFRPARPADPAHVAAQLHAIRAELAGRSR